MSRSSAAQALREELVGDSPVMKQFRESVREIVEGDQPVLIEGERGTGRARVARVVHRLGPRRDSGFVCVDPEEGCAGDLDQLLARAQGGTLLVKDIAHVGRQAQRRLARVLKRSSGRTGESGEVWDVRVIAATGSDLARAVEDELFESELFERLRPRRVTMPALRQRPEDVEPLLEVFGLSQSAELGVGRPVYSAPALDKLRNYSWPGNVAELRDVVRRLCLRRRRGPVEVVDVEAVLPPIHERVPLEQISFEEMVRAKIDALLRRMEGYPIEDLYEEVLARVERPLIALVLERTRGNQIKAAEILGLNRNTLRKKISERRVATSHGRPVTRKKRR